MPGRPPLWSEHIQLLEYWPFFQIVTVKTRQPNCSSFLAEYMSFLPWCNTIAGRRKNFFEDSLLERLEQPTTAPKVTMLNKTLAWIYWSSRISCPPTWKTGMSTTPTAYTYTVYSVPKSLAVWSPSTHPAVSYWMCIRPCSIIYTLQEHGVMVSYGCSRH